MKKFYITTSIAYVNAAPHVGFAMEVCQADCLARYHRLKGEEVYFLTGTDEHGVKMYETAKSLGKDTKAFADENAEKFKALKELLNLSNDGFIRTSEDYHKAGAQKLWKALKKSGDIYKGKYEGKYCSGCEAFISDKDLVDGKCPTHDKVPQVVKEENYFFRLSKYSEKIREVIASGELKVLPEARKNEMLNIIGEIFKDVSFSRPRDVLPWGVTVPDDSSQVMYVWCDALSNYITALGYGEEGKKDGGKDGAKSVVLFKKFWPCDVHLIGKDILRFHAGVWIGMLLSAGISLPKVVFVHGFITSEGKKMSKSLGNVVDPSVYVDKYGADALRYYLLKEIPTGDDGDFSDKRFIELYNSDLANSFGNLVNRVVMMVDRYLGGKIFGKEENFELEKKIAGFWKSYDKAMGEFNIKVALDAASELLAFGNKYVDEQKPWELAKTDKGAVAAVLYNLLEVIRNAALMLYPVIPGKTEEVFGMLGIKGSEVAKACGYGKYSGFLKEGGMIKKGEALFPKIEDVD